MQHDLFNFLENFKRPQACSALKAKKKRQSLALGRSGDTEGRAQNRSHLEVKG